MQTQRARQPQEVERHAYEHCINTGIVDGMVNGGGFGG
jgi:hypothetical protein